jgi:antagonist of KipI
VAPALGSRSTYLPGGFGGLGGRALREGDEIELGAKLPGAGGSRRHLSWRVSPSVLPAYSPHPVLRAIRGAQAGDFGAELWGTEFQVSPKSDRMGLRLAGRKLPGAGGAELPSSAVAPGTVQVPSDGHPILLMADAQTIGGYPQAAHIIGPDLPLAAQLRPGDSVRLSEVSVEEAHRLALARERDLAMVRLGFPA